MLELKNIHFEINEKVLVRNISFSAKPGEHLVILGANGAGKSTLLKILSGEISTYSGQIILNGENLNNFSNSELARLRAVMPQEVQLSFPFRAIEVVEMGHSPHVDLHNSDEITQRCMELFDVSHLADRRYPTLSGGEKQRVQLARVFCQLDDHSESLPHALEQDTNTPNNVRPEARFLFLDECTSALDPAHQHTVFEAVNKIKQGHVGVISVMHDLNLASQYADKILILKEGNLLCLGGLEETLTSSNLEDAYAIKTEILSHPVSNKPLIVNLGA